MRIHVSDPALVPSLLAFLSRSVDCVAAAVCEDEIEVSLLGSYDPQTHEVAIDMLVRAWEAARALSDD